MLPIFEINIFSVNKLNDINYNVKSKKYINQCNFILINYIIPLNANLIQIETKCNLKIELDYFAKIFDVKKKKNC